MIEIRQAAITGAADKILAAAFTGESWSEALSGFAEAAGARGAVLIGECAGDHPQGGIRMTMLPTPSIADHIAAYRAGDIPRDPRIDRVRPCRGGGFLPDFGSFSAEELTKDPYYAEHLRPYGLGWHACAFLSDWSSRHSLYLNLKREYCHGHYTPQDIAIIDRALPALKTAAAISSARLGAEATGYARALGDAGVFALDPLGCATPLNEAAARLLDGDLTLRHRRLTAHLPAEQRRLDRAVALALTPPAGPGFAVLATAAASRRLIVRAVPLPGSTRDLFGAALALVVVEIWEPPSAPSPQLAGALRESFGLTGMEARVAALVAAGVAPIRAARMLGIAEGTTRNHLKSAMAKLDVGRQAELAALVAAMRL